jgi:hypothetical protein
MEKPAKSEKPKTGETLLERIRDKRGDTPRSIVPEVIQRELGNVAHLESYVTEGGLLADFERIYREDNEAE